MKKRVYFKNLNGIRAIAAFMVVINHLELLKFNNKIESFFILNGIANFGSLGVTIFFVLSGFLITSLVCIEKENTQKISVRKFYMRRVLRIWPLFFLILILGYSYAVYFDSYSISTLKTSALYSVFFLTNVAMVLKLLPDVILPIWSIGVEEQFYLVWPWLIKKINFNKLIYAMLALLFLFLFLKFASIVFHFTFLRDILFWTRFDCLITGGIIAVIKFSDFKLKKLLVNKIAQNINLILLLIYTALALTTNITVIHTVYGGFVGILLLGLTEEKKVIPINLENKVLNYLGNISYGIYLYNFFVVNIIFSFLSIRIGNIILFNVLYYVSCIIIIILLSSVSYYLYEKPFLRIKDKY